MRNVLIVGNGGIGLAVAKNLMNTGNQVSMVARSPKAGDLVKTHELTELARLIKEESYDDIIVSTGLLSHENHAPEKNVSHLSRAWLDENISSNLMPTVLVAQALSHHVPRNKTFKLLTLSARVASITDNHLGGWYSYRMSKAALNMFVKNVSIEWRLRFPQAGIYAYHPGTVDTPLAAPFKKNIPRDQLFSAEKAAHILIKNLGEFGLEQSGSLIDWRGDTLQY